MATRKGFFATLGGGAVGALLGYGAGRRKVPEQGAAIQAPGAGVIDVRARGARGDDNLNDDHRVIAECVAEARERRAPLYFAPGTYRIDAIILDWDGARIESAGTGVTLRARAHQQELVRVSASRCVVGDLTLDGAGFTGVHGLVMAPADESDRRKRVDQNFNTIRRIEVQSCQEGIRLRPGPSVERAGDSGMFYNSFYDIHVKGCFRGIWLQRGLGATGANRNRFYSVRVGQSMNTGIQIDSGNTNNWYGVGCEGVLDGERPNRVPTAVIVHGNDGLTVLNRFYGLDIEACTRHVWNDNPGTEFHGILGIAERMAGAYPYGGLMWASGSTWDASTPVHRLATPLTTPATRQAGGITSRIANGGTFDIPIPTRRPVRLELMTNVNPTMLRVYYIASDGAANPVITNLVDTTGNSLSVSPVNPRTVRVRNGTGHAGMISWSLVVSSDGLP